MDFVNKTNKNTWNGSNCEEAEYGRDLGFGCSGNIVDGSGV